MTTLADRIRAALDETEQVAQDAGASFLGTSGRAWKRDMISCVEDADGRLVVYGEGTPTSAQAIHIALHDPERELRMVAAHRKILDLHRQEGQVCTTCHGPEVMQEYYDHDSEEETVEYVSEPAAWPCPTVTALAEAYGVEA